MSEPATSAPSGRSRVIVMQDEYLRNTGPTSRELATLRAWRSFPTLTLFAEAFLARIFPTRGNVPDLLAHAAGFGPSLSASFAWLDRDTSSWKTFRRCGVEASARFSKTWPRAGSMRSGIVCQHRPLAPLTAGTGYSSWPTPVNFRRGNRSMSAGATYRPSLHEMAERNLWPTPTAGEHKHGGRYMRGNLTLTGAVKLWPTPIASDAKGSLGIHRSDGGLKNHLFNAVKRWPTPLARDARSFKGAMRMPNSEGSEPLVVQVGGTLNPTWVELLMGFPEGWTDGLQDPEKPSTTGNRRAQRSAKNKGSIASAA